MIIYLGGDREIHVNNLNNIIIISHLYLHIGVVICSRWFPIKELVQFLSDKGTFA